MLVLQTLGIFGLMGLVLCATLPPKITPAGCEHGGKFYMMGQHFKPSPCEYCQCDFSGRAMCAIADCVLPMCHDYVRLPDKCCPVCPNGENCDYNGHTIKVGEMYKPDPYTTCRCPSGFNTGSAQAVCARMLHTVTPHIVIDPVPGN